MERFEPEALRATAAALLIKAGLPADQAGATADGLLRADLRGVSTHGVSNMLRLYLDWLRTGKVNPRPDMRVVWSRGALCAIDSDNALGLAILPGIVDDVIERAKVHGIAAASVSRGRHAGMMAHHALRIAEAGMIGIALTATSARVVPTFGREPRLGTNPIAVAAPMQGERYLCFDAATSMVAGNRVTNALRTGAPITRAAVVENDGTVNATPIPPSEHYLRRLAPVGGLVDEASHKGYGLAVFVELLCGTLLDDGGLPGRDAGGATHFVAAIAPPEHGGEPSFIANVTRLADYLNATPPAVDRDRVFYPGEMEAEEEVRRRRDGIPLHEEVVSWLRGACASAGIPMPASRASGAAA